MLKTFVPMQAAQESMIADLQKARTANASLADDLHSLTTQLADARQAMDASSSQLQAVQVCTVQKSVQVDFWHIKLCQEFFTTAHNALLLS